MSRRDLEFLAASSLVLLTLVASVAFRAVFDGWAFAIAPLIAVIGAAAVSTMGRLRKWLLGETLLVSLISFVVAGAVVVGRALGPSGFSAFFDGLIGGWVSILDVLPPASTEGAMMALPFSAAWIGTTLGLELLARRPGVIAPLAGPTLTLVVSVLFSAGNTRLILFQGAILVLLLLGYLSCRQQSLDEVPEAERGVARTAIGVVTVLLVLLAGVLVGPNIGPEPPQGRVELRQYRPTPWDPMALPSPLSELKAAYAETKKDEIDFSITGPAVDRIQVATLEVYDGRVWGVAARGGDAEFRMAGEQLPTPDGFPGDVTQEHEITIGGLRANWLPSPAGVTRIRFDDTTKSIRINSQTGTMALPEGLSPDLRYSVESVVRDPVLLADLEAASFPMTAAMELAAVPPGILNVAADFVEGKERGWSQVTAIATRLALGYYSDVDVAPGHTYYRVAALLSGSESELVGFAEQYAASAAILARSIGLPARVVVGYTIPADRWRGETAEVTFGDTDAWIEVRSEEYGWIPVTVTPDKSRVPEPSQVVVQERSIAEANPPPPPSAPTTSTTLPLAVDQDLREVLAPEEAATEIPQYLRIAVYLVGVPMLLLLVGALAVIGMKAWRRRRRMARPTVAGRVSGAWIETLERFGESGLSVSAASTPAEAACGIGGAIEDAVVTRGLNTLAAVVDRAAFHQEPPAETAATMAWSMSRDLVSVFRSSATGVQRLRWAISPRVLIPGELLSRFRIGRSNRLVT